jgi:hypothetical protein
MNTARTNDWQPIETAPKDGTRILIAGCVIGPLIRIGWWGAGRYLDRVRGYERDWTDGNSHGWRPTHWMRLPEPPALRTDEAGKE